MKNIIFLSILSVLMISCKNETEKETLHKEATQNNLI